MKRPPRAVGAGGDAVFLGFGNVLATHFLQPAGCLGSALEVEAAGVENLLQRHRAHAHRQDLGMGIEPAQDSHQLLAFGRGDQVDLADQDDVSELHLVDQQVGDRTLVVLAQAFTAAGEAVGGMQITKEIHPVDHRDQRVEARQVGQALPLLVAEGEGFRHRQRLGYPGGLDQQVIETAFAGQTADFLQQVLAQRAADAAVTHLDELFLGAVEDDVALHFEGRVDIHLAHVVDDHRHTPVFAVSQHMFEHGALAGAEEARQHGDGKTVGHAVTSSGIT